MVCWWEKKMSVGREIFRGNYINVISERTTLFQVNCYGTSIEIIIMKKKSTINGPSWSSLLRSIPRPYPLYKNRWCFSSRFKTKINTFKVVSSKFWCQNRILRWILPYKIFFMTSTQEVSPTGARERDFASYHHIHTRLWKIEKCRITHLFHVITQFWCQNRILRWILV